MALLNAGFSNSRWWREATEVDELSRARLTPNGPTEGHSIVIGFAYALFIFARQWQWNRAKTKRELQEELDLRASEAVACFADQTIVL